MNDLELRDLDEARRFLLQGLWWQRTLRPSAAHIRLPLEWALEIVSAGQPMPPIGFVADLGYVALGLDREQRGRHDSDLGLDLEAALIRSYEDHVLGKLYADYRFERASDALRGYKERDRSRGLAFVIERFRERAGFPGVHLAPGLIRGMLGQPHLDELLKEGLDLRARDGRWWPRFGPMYQALIDACRQTGEILAEEDVVQLEHGTALADVGQQVAERQVLRIAARLDASLPAHRIQPLAGRQEVPTRVLDEDTYPVGGFASISTRGTIESLLRSQLAFMETQQRPDLFDIKYLLDDLYYYSRDENQFLRRRRSFLIALLPELTRTRFKDPELPVQRIVLLLALIRVLILKLSDWLSTDALRFEIVFVGENAPLALAQEFELLRMLLREGIANGTVRLLTRDAPVNGELVPAGLPHAELPALCADRARRSLCHVLLVGCSEPQLTVDDAVVTRLKVAGPRPALAVDDSFVEVEADDSFDCWASTLERLLGLFV